jgi:hypothetical protein
MLPGLQQVLQPVPLILGRYLITLAAENRFEPQGWVKWSLSYVTIVSYQDNISTTLEPYRKHAQTLLTETLVHY